MSGIDATAYVMRLVMKTPAHKLALLAVAARCDQNHSCYPSRALIAGEALISEERAKTILRELRRDGFLSARQRYRENGSKTSNRYFVHGPWDRWNDTNRPFLEIKHYADRDDRYAAIREGEFIPRPGPEGGGVAGDPSPSGGKEEGGVVSNPSRGVAGGPSQGVPSNPSVTGHSQPANANQPRPSVPTPEVGVHNGSGTDGGTDEGSGSAVPEAGPGGAGGGVPAAADAAPGNSAATGAGEPAAGGPVLVPGPRARQMGPGADLLVTVGKIRDVLMLSGKVLLDQGERVDGLLAGGWPRRALISILSAPIGEIRTSAGAVISGRITVLPHRPPASYAAGADPSEEARPERTGSGDTAHSSTAAAGRSVDEALNRRVHPECACGDPLAAGFNACPACLGWPLCSGGCGRRSTDGTCPGCRTEADHAAVAAEPTEDGTCPGHSGPCGREVVSLGWCGACRISAQREADARQDDPGAYHDNGQFEWDAQAEEASI